MAFWNKWMFKSDFISVVEHCGTKTRKFLHIATIWVHMDHKLFYLYFTGGHKWHYLIRKKEEARIHNLSLETVHLLTECQIKVRLLNRMPLDLVPLMCGGKDVQGASLVWQGERGNTFLLLFWEEDESGTALMSEPPSPFSQMM